MSAGSKPVAVVGSINIDLVTNTKRIPVRGETVVGSGFQIHSGGKMEVRFRKIDVQVLR